MFTSLSALIAASALRKTPHANRKSDRSCDQFRGCLRVLAIAPENMSNRETVEADGGNQDLCLSEKMIDFSHGTAPLVDMEERSKGGATEEVRRPKILLCFSEFLIDLISHRDQVDVFDKLSRLRL